MSPAALLALADAADALARLARAAVVDAGADTGTMLPVAHAAQLAGTTVRVIRDAIRAGALPAFGRQRDRAVRRGDLTEWIESRRAVPVVGPDDPDLERRIRRIARRQSAGRGR